MSLDLFNIVNTSCWAGHTTYLHRILFASIIPVLGLCFSALTYARLASKPSIGVVVSTVGGRERASGRGENGVRGHFFHT